MAGEDAQKSLFHLHSCQILWDHLRGDLVLRCDWYAKM